MKKHKKGIEMIKSDFKERFVNYETVKGIYFLLAGLLTTYISIFYQQFVIQGIGATFGLYFVIEGLRKIFINRIKQIAKQTKLIKAREKRVGK